MSGSVGKASVKVTEKLLAPALKTGSVNVLSTAILSALMEEASCNSLAKITPKCSVGVVLDLKHRRPSALGAKVTAISTIKTIDQKSINFDIKCYDETGLVGTATHRRVFVDKDEFEKKCYSTFEKAIRAK